MRKNNEIIEALKTIKETCVETRDCKDCPFCITNRCYLQENAPDGWEINTEEIVWRAFK